jgi:hypothetical protein
MTKSDGKGLLEAGRGYYAKILLDSIGPAGVRLTTWELRYPRMVHAELMTHRLFSRNSASSRAIPNERLVAQVLDDPALPVWWGKNQSGMQAREALEGNALECAQVAWLKGRLEAVDLSRRLAAAGLHKQIANRPLEPWMFITVIVSATEWSNWYALRDHPDAQPEIAWIARRMHAAHHANEPTPLCAGDWHMPLVQAEDARAFNDADLRRISVGRCARVSYLTHDGRRAPEEDMALHDRLAGSSPGHWSPFEHVAEALPNTTPSGNFRGWRQYRKTFLGEHVGGIRP